MNLFDDGENNQDNFEIEPEVSAFEFVFYSDDAVTYSASRCTSFSEVEEVDQEAADYNYYAKIERTACPCCGYITIPKKDDGLGYICPICIWEIDPFVHFINEPSDLNHKITLIEARKNYQKYGATLDWLAKGIREPRDYELPENNQ